MKKHKLILLMFILFFTSGCSLKYEVELYNSKVNESVDIIYKKDQLNGLSPLDKTNELILESGSNGDFLAYSKKKSINKPGNKGVKLINKYDNLDMFLNESKLFSSCYNLADIIESNELYSLRTSYEFTCFDELKESEKITIAVRTNHKVKEHNADKKKGHTYYWHINKDNYKKKPISIQMYKNRYVWNYNNVVVKRILLLLVVITITVGIAYFCYKKYNKSMNDFSDV